MSNELTWQGDTLGNPLEQALIWTGDGKQMLFADALEIGLHNLGQDGREHILNQVAICWDKGLLHPLDQAAIEDYCRRSIPPSIWARELLDTGVQ